MINQFLKYFVFVLMGICIFIGNAKEVSANAGMAAAAASSMFSTIYASQSSDDYDRRRKSREAEEELNRRARSRYHVPEKPLTTEEILSNLKSNPLTNGSCRMKEEKHGFIFQDTISTFVCDPPPSKDSTDVKPTHSKTPSTKVPLRSTNDPFSSTDHTDTALQTDSTREDLPTNNDPFPP